MRYRLVPSPLGYRQTPTNDRVHSVKIHLQNCTFKIKHIRIILDGKLLKRASANRRLISDKCQACALSLRVDIRATKEYLGS